MALGATAVVPLDTLGATIAARRPRDLLRTDTGSIVRCVRDRAGAPRPLPHRASRGICRSPAAGDCRYRVARQNRATNQRSRRWLVSRVRLASYRGYSDTTRATDR